MALTPAEVTELFLLSTARGYNLSEKAERVRSVQDLEVLFLRICRELQPDLFVEAGAKDAETSRRARKYVNGRIVAFEANPFTYENFRSKDNLSRNVEYLHRALSDRDGDVSFNVRVVDGRNAADGKGSLLQSHDGTVGYTKVTVAGSRLDTFFPPASFRRWASWVDVEGASKQALTGASEILDQCEAIYIEVSDRATWEGQWLTGDVIDYLDRFGLVPMARDFQSRYLYNMLFVRREYIRQDRIRLFLIEYFGRNAVGTGGGSPDLYAIEMKTLQEGTKVDTPG